MYVPANRKDPCSGRRHKVEHPAADADAIIQALSLGRNRSFARVAGQRPLVLVGDMGEVEHVVLLLPNPRLGGL